MRAIIDRFEEDKAVVEVDGEMLTVPRTLFKGAQEGDHVEITVLGKPHSGSEDPLPEEISGDAFLPAGESEAVITDEQTSGEDTHSIFERLRAKRRRTNLSPSDDPER